MKYILKKSTVEILCIGLLSLFCVIAIGCEKLPTQNGDDDIKETDSNFAVQGTKWKLAGVVDVQADTMKVLEPQDCSRCYSFTFDTDTTAAGWSTSNILVVQLLPVLRVFLATEALGTDFYLEDAILFCNAIGTIISYDLNENELKFYYNENKNYLLFKPL